MCPLGQKVNLEIYADVEFWKGLCKKLKQNIVKSFEYTLRINLHWHFEHEAFWNVLLLYLKYSFHCYILKVKENYNQVLFFGSFHYFIRHITQFFVPNRSNLRCLNKNIFFKLFCKDFYILKDFDFFWLIFYFDSFWNEIPCIFNSNLHKTNRWWDHSVHFWYFPLFRFLLNVSFSRPTDVPKFFEPIRKNYLTWHSFFQIHYG